MNAVRSLLFLLVLVAITLTLLLAGAAGVGAVLHRLMPSMEPGTAVLTGLVGLSVSTYFVLHLWNRAWSVQEELSRAEVEELLDTMHRPARRRRPRR